MQMRSSNQHKAEVRLVNFTMTKLILVKLTTVRCSYRPATEEDLTFHKKRMIYCVSNIKSVKLEMTFM